MKISDQQLDKFIEIHERKHGVVLDRQEAYEEALRLLRLVEIVELENYKLTNEQQA